MGIRYERDSRRDTNGPLIFFSIMKDEAFEEEIRSAFISGLSFYAYRFPGDSMMCYGSSEGYVEGIGVPGFSIGFFAPDKPFITIPYDGIKRKEETQSFYTMPSDSTSYESYSREVKEIIAALKEGKGDKVVASRVIVMDKDFDIADKFYELSQRFPEAFVFCFSTPATGCWIGASPELLLEGKENEFKTMALAGTRRAFSEERPWDEKNIEEQRIVSDYICEKLAQHGMNAVIKETYTKTTGEIEHICTPISAKFQLNDTKNGNMTLEKLLRDMSPTPALCGSPKEFALTEIKNLENFDRGCYGGFCGPFHSIGDFTFHVVLRCASVNERSYCVYAGGGITDRSEVSSEWHETAMKASNTFGISEII